MTQVTNAQIADRACGYDKRWGAAASVDAGMSGATAGRPLGDGNNADGECRAFVNAIIRATTGISVAYGPDDYQRAFREHGQSIGLRGGLRGDVVQVGNGVHTAIITRNFGNGEYEVVDSNFKKDHRVSIHRWTLPAGAQIWRLAPVRFALHSPAAGHFVSAELGYQGTDQAMLRARADAVLGWERFLLVGDHTQGCGIKSEANDQFVSAELQYPGGTQGEVRARNGVQLSWETFEITGDTENLIGIKSKANNSWVSAELRHTGAAHNMLRARSSAWMEWEQFRLSWV